MPLVAAFIVGCILAQLGWTLAARDAAEARACAVAFFAATLTLTVAGAP